MWFYCPDCIQEIGEMYSAVYVLDHCRVCWNCQGTLVKDVPWAAPDSWYGLD